MSLTSTLRAITLVFFVIAWPARAIDTSAEEKVCQEIGFKPKTEKFANCVLELYERGGTAQGRSAVQSPDDEACQKYGYLRGTSGYADCRQKIDLARQEYEQKKRDYENQIAKYEEEKKRYEEAKEEERRRRVGVAMLQYGLGIASGMRPEQASAYAQGLPIPQRPQMSPDLQSFNHRIILPNGNVMNCRQNGANPNIFCY